MLPPLQSGNETNNTSYPLARIDTLDETYALPIREFFAKNGCRVIINEKTEDNVLYWIIIGDAYFVKDILAHRIDSHTSTLILCWEAEELDIPKGDTHKLIVYVDPIPLASTALQTIMYHFFVRDEETLYLQTKKMKPQTKKKLADKPKKLLERIPNARENFSHENREADTKRIAQTIHHIFNNTPQKKVISKKPFLFRSFISITISIVCIFLVYPFSLGLSVYSFQKSVNALQMNSEYESKLWHSTAKKALAVGKYVQPIGNIPWIFVYGTAEAIRQQSLIDALEKSDIVLREVIELIEIAKNVSQSLVPIANSVNTIPLPVAISQIKSRLFPLQTNIDRLLLLSASMNRDRPFAITSRFGESQVLLAISALKKYSSLLTQVERLLLLYPYIAGFPEKQTILVLLQNNAELRPTGGFIGSLMKVTTHEGKVLDTTVEDVYSYDGQLKGHVDPPLPIREVLGQEHWFLRDSNWNPDFAITAQKALWFYEKETGESVNVLAGINADLFVSLLNAIGPIDLPDLNEKITESNFYIKALYYTQNNFFPGSTQKKDFLGQLITGISKKLLQKNDAKTTMKIFSVFLEAMANRNIQWYFTNTEAQRIVHQFRWSGAFPATTSCTNEIESCLFLPIAVNEANLGVNKANIFLTRNDIRTITITDSEIKQTIERTIIHRGSGEPGSGTYKTYIRFYVPKNATLTSFTADGTPIETKKKVTIPPLPFGEMLTEHPLFATVGTAQLIPEGSQITLKLSFTTPLSSKMKENKRIAVAIFEQKQSGIAEVPTQVKFSVAAPYTIHYEDASLANQSYLEYNTTLDRDDHTVVDIQK